MARRRLNKKVAFMGTAVFLLLALGIVAVILMLSRDPAQFVADGDAARAAGNYESARNNYAKAIGMTESPQAKIDLYFKVADVAMAMQDWRTVRAAWGQIVTADPQNLRARLGRLKYWYIAADSLSEVGQSMQDQWDEALKQATELLDVAGSADVLNEPRARWETSFGAAEQFRWTSVPSRLGPCLHFIEGRAAFEVARLGAVTSPDEWLDRAQASLDEARQLDPNNADVYYYLAQVALQKGKNAASRGNTGQQEAAARQAEDLLAEGVQATGGASHVRVSLLSRRFALARAGEVPAARTRMQALEPEYQDLAQRFPESPEALAAVAEFYAVYSAYSGSRTPDALDRAIEMIQKAVALDPNSVLYAKFASRLCFRKYLLFRDEASLHRAVALAEHGLGLPDARDTAGPRRYARQANRFSLSAFLARCCLEQILTLDKTLPQRAELLARMERAVHEIEQIRSSGQNPQVVMWQGMLELARGHTSTAIQSLYTAYEQIKASRPPEERDTFLAYTLAKIFQGTTEVGGVVEFLGSALGGGVIDSQPEALLDYGQALLQARSYDAAVNAVDLFEERFGQTDRSKALRVAALIAKGLVAEAQEAIAGMKPNDSNALRLGASVARAQALQLRAVILKEQAATGGPQDSGQTAQMAELRDCRRREADLMCRLLDAAPAMADEQDAATLCGALIEQKDAALAREVVDAFLKHHPDSLEMAFCRRLLSEPDPINCTEARREEIREQTILAIADPVQRSMELGLFYQQQERMSDAVAQWRKALDATDSPIDAQEPAYLRAKQLSPRHVAASCLFDLARRQENWRLAEEMVTIARKDNLDDCGGSLFAARLAFARGDNTTALNDLNECLEQRPIFSHGYMLRGNVYAAMDNERACIDDFRKASELNPVDPLVVKALANALCVRNARLAGRVSSEQRAEAKEAVEQAIRLDPRDVNLLMVYATMIGGDEPMKALALHQTIQKNAPNAQNAVLLGKLASQVAQKEADETKRQPFLAIAESAFEQAEKMEPNNPVVLASYAECLAAAYRMTSDNVYLEKAIRTYESLLEKTPKDNSGVVLNNLAYMLAQGNRRLSDALEYARTALDQKPDEAGYLDTYGYVLHKAGRNAEAVESLTAAAREYEAQGTVSPDVYEHLGMAHEALGDRTKALSAYRRALALGTGTIPESMKSRITSAVRRLTP